MAWILPTYNRPERCQIMLDSIIAAGCSTPGCVIVNGPGRLAEYKALRLPDNWRMIFLPVNIGMCQAMNYYFLNNPDEPWYGWLGDDEFIISKGWDRRLILEAGKILIAHSNDGWQSDMRLHGCTAIGGDLVRLMGYIFPFSMWHWFSDNMYERIAADFDLRRYCRDVQTENRHYLRGKSEHDATYAMGAIMSKEDGEVFNTWLHDEYPLVKGKINKYIKDLCLPS